MSPKKFWTIITVLCLAAGSALGDWDPDKDPYKWAQPPDLSDMTGIDVNATFPKVLADDFLCDQTMLITDIHTWCSWRSRGEDQTGNPLVPKPTPDQFTFRLSLHSDIPADPAEPTYSMPGPELWSRVFTWWDGQGTPPALYFTERVYATVYGEGWYDPNEQLYIPHDHDLVWQYNFYIDPTEAFRQEGTSTAPKVYWLDLSCTVPDPPAGEPAYYLGWKTSTMQWNDDAVFGHLNAAGQPMGDWVDLHYPIGHPEELQSLDLSFVITPEPATMALLALGAVAVLSRRRR